MSKEPIIKTDRLILRPLTLDDAEACYSWNSDERVTKYMSYNLHYDYWHKGYCTEAMRAIIDFAHKELGVNKICSDHAVDNPRSGRVMEKCGLKFDHYGEYTKLDGSQTFQAKFYKMELL